MADKITWNLTDEGPGRKRLETELISQDGTFVEYYFFFSYWPFLHLKFWMPAKKQRQSLAKSSLVSWLIRELSMSWYSVSDDDEDDKD